VFGGTGDLATRKLLPALFHRDFDGQIPADARIFAISRRDFDAPGYAAFVKEALGASLVGADAAAVWQRFSKRLHHVSLDAQSDVGWERLAAALGPPNGHVRVFYMATSPKFYGPIARRLGQAGLAGGDARLVVEKPIGSDLASARRINDEIGAVFAESQIYRIDHYLGKEAVQNLIAMRFANSLFEPLWNSLWIDHVQITVAETVGLEGRAGYYDTAGAVRDMVQNHLLQLLCIVAMEAPISLDPDDVRNEKLKVLRSLRRLELADIQRDTVRGQYARGAIDGAPAVGYLDEAGVPATSQTETFVAIKAQVHNARWAGVPFFLRTGKRMPQRLSEIIFEFSAPPFSIFSGMDGSSHPNRLIITLQPEESIRLQMMAKEPGSGMRMRPVYLDLDLNSAFEQRRAEAYERLLIDVIRGRLTHFMRRDELEAAWRWVDPVVQGWAALGERPRPYAAGTWGPAAAAALVARHDAVWSEAH
jgi:glucose-6-phosphate 1-dehydrogenase